MLMSYLSITSLICNFMIRVEKKLAVFISVIVCITVGILLICLLDKFGLRTMIDLPETLVRSNRYYEDETDSLLSFIGYWHIIISVLSGMVTYKIICSESKIKD